jgi:HlyD family secretion protein
MAMAENKENNNPNNQEGTPCTVHPSPFTQIELRSEEFQEVLGSVPHWILRWGITVLAVVVVILLAGSAVVKYPDVIPAQIVLTGSTPPAVIVAHATGKLKELFAIDNQTIKAGDYLAVIDNPARTEDVLSLKNHLLVFSSQFSVSSSNFQLSTFNFQLGSLQSPYSAFRTALHEYTEYKRLMYYSKKIEMTKDRIIQYEKQYKLLLNQQKLTEEQLSLVESKFRRDSLLNLKGMISNEEMENSKSAYLGSLMACENISSSLNSMQIQIGQLEESLLDTGYQYIETLNNLQIRLQTQLSQLQTEILNWELIIINDGCSDNTEKYIAGYLSDKRISYVKNEVNQGLGFAINQGLELAKYNYIAYLPSDFCIK